MLARSGRTGPELLAAFRAVTAFVNGFAQVEIGSPVTSRGGADDLVGQVLALPPQEYPHLIGAATTAATSDPVDEFRAGLDILIAGLEQGR